MNKDDERDVYREENLFETFDSRVGDAERAIEQLDDAMRPLPERVSDKAAADPDIEHLFALKEERASRVQLLVGDFQRYLGAITKELDTLKRNSFLIRDAHGRLHHEEPGRELDYMERRSLAIYDKVVSQRQQALVAISRLQAALEKANRKKWPHGQPRKHLRIGSVDAPTVPGIPVPRPAAGPAPIHPTPWRTEIERFPPFVSWGPGTKTVY